MNWMLPINVPLLLRTCGVARTVMLPKTSLIRTGMAKKKGILSIYPSIHLSISPVISNLVSFLLSSSFQSINQSINHSNSVYYEKSIEKRFPKAKILRDTEVVVSTCSPISTIHVIIFQELKYISLYLSFVWIRTSA